MWDLIMQAATVTGIIVLFVYVVLPIITLILETLAKLLEKFNGKEPEKTRNQELKDTYIESMKWMNSGGKK